MLAELPNHGMRPGCRRLFEALSKDLAKSVEVANDKAHSKSHREGIAKSLAKRLSSKGPRVGMSMKGGKLVVNEITPEEQEEDEA